ncbi:MAG: hypothetical protein QXJ62_00115 [Nitrososphaeria archaeon]
MRKGFGRGIVPSGGAVVEGPAVSLGPSPGLSEDIMKIILLLLVVGVLVAVVASFT